MIEKKTNQKKKKKPGRQLNGNGNGMLKNGKQADRQNNIEDINH